MTAAQQEDWVATSLARVEELEALRQELLAKGQISKLIEVDAEIKALYEALEAYAEEAENGPTEAEAPPEAPFESPVAVAAPVEQAPVEQAPVEPAAATSEPEAPAPEVSAPAMAAAVPNNPLQSAPFQAVPAQPGGYSEPAPDFVTAEPSLDLGDVAPKRSMGLVLAAAVVLVGGGVAAFMFMGNKKEEPETKPTGPAVVIEAGEIPEDTQEPNVAKGADADRTRGSVYSQSNRGDRSPKRSGGGSRSSGSRSSSSSSSSSKADEKRKIELKGSKDPLAGVD